MKHKGVTICLDFDGVLHSYTSGWTGIDDVADPPVPGAVDFCKWLWGKGYKVIILSARFDTKTHPQNAIVNIGMIAVTKWLDKWDFPKQIKLTATKQPSSLYVDDRGFRFTGDFKGLEDFILEQPNQTPSTWVKKKKDEDKLSKE